MGTLIHLVMQRVYHLTPQQWLVALCAALVIGVLLLRGFGSQR